MDIIDLREAENKFKEARKASFRIFQLVFGEMCLFASSLGHQGHGSSSPILFLFACSNGCVYGFKT